MSKPTLIRKLGGSAHALAGNTLEFYEECERTSGVVSTHVWGLPVFIVTDPELIEEVFIRKQRCFIKSAGLRASRLAFGQGLLTSDGELWKRQRQMIQPAFRTGSLEAYWPWVQAAMERVLADWGESGVRDIHQDMTDLCFEVLAVPLFGEDMAGARPLVVEAAGALHAFHEGYSRWAAVAGIVIAGMRAVSTRFGRPDLVFDPSYLPTPYAKRFRAAVGKLNEFVFAFIERRRAEPPREDLISLLLAGKDENGAPLSTQQIRDEVVTMFFAGHETGAASISWALYLLAQHPQTANRLAAEPEGGPLAIQVMHEALRLYPPAYRVSRTVVQTCRLGLTEIPAGAELIIPQWAVHRSARFFEEPCAFRPQRWSHDFAQHLPRFAYFPFGGGPRTCIGNNFGLQEGKTIVAEIVRRYALGVPDGVKAEPELGVTLLPREGTLKLSYQRRQKPLPA